MNDDRGRDIAEKLASRIMNDEQIANRQSLIGVIESALATVRREEREAAFKDAITLVQAVTNDNDLDDGGFFEAGFIAARTKSIDALIEAPASGKGEMNG